MKVAQVLYACTAKENSDLVSAENELQSSLQKSYDLYHYILLLIAESRRYTELKADAIRNRIGGVRVNEMYNEQFMNNKFARQLGENVDLYSYANDRGLSWSEKTDFIKAFIQRISRSEYYYHYTAKKALTYAEDKKFWRDVIANEFENNDELQAILETESIYWSDDLDIITSFVEKTIKQFKEENGAEQPLLPMFKEEADKSFATQLLDSVILNKQKLDEIISKYLINWDLDRVATMDIIILKAAIAELLYFSSIPVNVTLNEYIEIAKFYGSPKSSKFINGILDKVVKDLRQTSELAKFKAGAKVTNTESDKTNNKKFN